MNQKQTIALIKDTIGHSMKRVIRELGTPALPHHDLLTLEQSAFLRTQLPELTTENAELNRVLSTKILEGKVVQVGNTSDGSSLFTVHVPMNQATVVLTLEYYLEEWKLRTIESVRTRKTQVRQSLVGGVFGAAVAAAVALIIWGVGASHDPVSEVKSEGYIVLTKAQYQEQVPASAGQATKGTTTADASKGASSASVSGTGTTASSSSADQGQQITFTMQQGMTTSDLTSWLKDNGLISDQAQFDQQLTQQGIDTKLRPGDYVFKKGMTEQDVLSVLQQS